MILRPRRKCSCHPERSTVEQHLKICDPGRVVILSGADFASYAKSAESKDPYSRSGICEIRDALTTHESK
jgi:hypothetical protein